MDSGLDAAFYAKNSSRQDNRIPSHKSFQASSSTKEIAERAEFLKGLTGRFGSTIDLPSGPKEKPGVSDPAEPECKGAFCVLFTVVEAPDLSNVNGGDPINPSFGPEAPPVTIH